MAYLARPDSVTKRNDLAQILPGVRSVVTVGVNYHTKALPTQFRDDPSRGIVASYAWGGDYHDLLTPRLRQLGALVEVETQQPVAYRAYVDTGPILERELAARSGLGFVGKNTNLIHPRLGSWLFLGELLLAVELPPGKLVRDSSERMPVKREMASSPRAGSTGDFAQLQRRGSCGQCTRCLDACPTGALVAPYVLDARHCISYLTIELKGAIPRRLRPLMGNRVFGCDICQEVCPWNRRFAQTASEPAFEPRPDGVAPRLLDLITLDSEGFRLRFHGSSMQRAKRRGLLRNVAVALGNWGAPVAVPLLARALRDAEPLIRGHAAWALGGIATGEARDVLQKAKGAETDGWVREELELALYT
jgi:epoxyqueuosine reductase